MTTPYSPPPELVAALDRLKRRSLLAGAAAMALCAVGFFTSREQFFRSYLVAFVFWNGLALGSLAIGMLHQMTGGAWGIVIRRVLGAATRTFPASLALFLPLAFGLPALYQWARPELVAADHLLHLKAPYLNVPFFLGRSALYFAIWIALVHLLNKWSLAQDYSTAEPYHTRLQMLSGPGLLLYGATVTFSSIDWVMSLDPHWFSTIYGILFMGGQGVGALALVIAVLPLLVRHEPLKSAITHKHVHDLGKLLFAFIMLWAYFSFSQFLIVWSANLPEEIPWYLTRMNGGWQWIGLALILFHFVLPFLLLLSRDAKRNRRILAPVAVGILAMRVVDLFWMAAPSFAERVSVHWLDLAALAGVGGLWLAAFFHQLQQRPLLPVHDPMLEEALAHGRH
ncbi:MAG: hypothetical protein ACRD96_02315 [Bryobacteraceae bacterium]